MSLDTREIAERVVRPEFLYLPEHQANDDTRINAQPSGDTQTEKEDISPDTFTPDGQLPNPRAQCSTVTPLSALPVVQMNSQIVLGPPHDWTEPIPGDGCELFVGHIPKHYQVEDLLPSLQRAGRVYKVRLVMNSGSVNRGYAFVLYSDREETKRAQQVLDRLEIRPGSRLGACLSRDIRRLFVGGLPKVWTRDHFFAYVSNLTAGIKEVILPPDIYNKSKNRGYGFVVYTSHQSAAQAKKRMQKQNHVVENASAPLNVDWAEPEYAVPEEQMEKVTVVYCRNVNSETNELDIETHFKHCGNVVRVKKVNDYAFVHYELRSEAARAIEQLHGSVLDDCRLEVTWARPGTKEDIIRYKAELQSKRPQQNRHTLRPLDLSKLSQSSSWINHFAHFGPRARLPVVTPTAAGYSPDNPYPGGILRGMNCPSPFPCMDYRNPFPLTPITPMGQAPAPPGQIYPVPDHQSPAQPGPRYPVSDHLAKDILFRQCQTLALPTPILIDCVQGAAEYYQYECRVTNELTGTGTAAASQSQAMEAAYKACLDVIQLTYTDCGFDARLGSHSAVPAAAIAVSNPAASVAAPGLVASPSYITLQNTSSLVGPALPSLAGVDRGFAGRLGSHSPNPAAAIAASIPAVSVAPPGTSASPTYISAQYMPPVVGCNYQNLPATFVPQPFPVISSSYALVPALPQDQPLSLVPEAQAVVVGNQFANIPQAQYQVPLNGPAYNGVYQAGAYGLH